MTNEFVVDELADDFETLDEIKDEWEEDSVGAYGDRGGIHDVHDEGVINLAPTIRDHLLQIFESGKSLVIAAISDRNSVFFDDEMEKLEKKRNFKRRMLFEAQDEIDRRKEELIEGVEVRLRQLISTSKLFTIHWRVV